MTGRLQGRVALITGSGNGIGRAIAELFAREGAVVGINDLKADVTRSVADAINAAGGQAVALPMDASSRQNVHAAVETLKSRYGRFDIMVNNAAWVRYEPIESITEKTMERMTAIGFSGVNLAATASVRVDPGAMALTRMPRGPRSAAAERVRPSTPDFMPQ